MLPSSWTIPAWYVDPGNSVGCASSSNSGTSATCVGGCVGAACPSGTGPLSTFQELLVHRWGCLGAPGLCPRLQQVTTLTFLSSHTNSSDPVELSVALEKGGSLQIAGSLGSSQTLCAGAITVTASKVKTAGASSLLTVTLPCAAATGVLVQNATHPSFAWPYTNTSGNTWTMTQPMTAGVPTQMGSQAGIVDTWTTGDSVTLYQPVAVNIASLSEQAIDYNGAQNNSVALTTLAIFDPLGANSWNHTVVGSGDPVFLSGNLIFVSDVWAQRLLVQDGVYGGAALAVWRDVLFSAGFQTSLRPVLYGGASIPTIFTAQYNGAGGSMEFSPTAGEEEGAVVSGDYIMGASHYFSGTSFCAYDNVTGVYLPSGKVWLTGPGSLSVATCDSALWGPGTLNVVGTRMQYPAGAGKAATTLAQSGLQIDGQTKACLVQPGAAGFGACNQAVSASTLDSDLGATNGCLNDGYSAICNFGTQSAP